MKVFEAIESRRSIRRYKNDPIPEAALEQVLEAGRIAPSAANRQEHKFIVVKDEGLRKALVPACNDQDFVGQAPVVIVGCSTNPTRVYAIVDVAIALDHMTLAAFASGLGTCWIGAFSEDKVKAVLGIPDEVKVVNVLPLGYPSSPGTPRPRKPKEELFVNDRWS